MRQIKLKKLDDDVSLEPNSYREHEDSDMFILNKLIEQIQPEEEKPKKENKKKKKNKDKKKKKKKKNKDSLFDKYGFGDLFTDDEEKEKKIKKEKVNKSDEDFYEYRFSSSLVLLKDLLKDINSLTDDSKKTLEQFKKSIQRGSFTAVTNQTSNIANLFNTKLSVIKEITTVNKNISDLEIKKFKDSGADVETDNLAAMDAMYDKIMGSDLSIKSPLEGNEKKDKKKKKNKEDTKKKEILFEEDDTAPLINLGEKEEYYDDINDDDDLDDIVENMIKSGEIELTDNELAFKYEKNKGIQIVVDKNVRTGRWNFRAIDQNGDTIYDYPLPNKKSIGKVKFDIDKGLAKDQLGNVYTVLFTRD